MLQVSSFKKYTSNVCIKSIRPADKYTRSLIGEAQRVVHVGYVNNLSRIRRSRKMSQGSLAEACGVKQATISRIESGINKPSYELMEKIAEVLGVTAVEILGLPEFEQTVLDKFRAASPKRRAALLALLESDA